MHTSNSRRAPPRKLPPAHPQVAQIANAHRAANRAVPCNYDGLVVANEQRDAALRELLLNRPADTTSALRWLVAFDDALRLMSGRGRPALARQEALRQLLAVDNRAHEMAEHRGFAFQCSGDVRSGVVDLRPICIQCRQPEAPDPRDSLDYHFCEAYHDQ